MTTITSRNPYTGEINATFETITDKEIDIIIDKAYTAYLSRKDVARSERKSLFLKLADLLERDIDYHARLETIEMGRLYDIARNGLKNSVNLIRRFANNAEIVLAHEPIDREGMTGHMQYDPIGIIYGIAPWNFPYNQLLRAAVPNILAGNTVIYKHASNVPLCAQAIGQLFIDAGFPEGVYTSIIISSSQSEHIIANPYVRGVNITG
jgi:succinate-semialdehyde dehydrogenase/glutarate-semialdehyde dehydrogenase